MKPTSRRRAAAGFTYVEVTAAFAVLVLGVMGFAGTVVYTGNLGRSTTKLWSENVAATGALEDVREDAASQWQSIGSTWDGHEVVASGASTTSDTLTTNVSSDPSKLNSSDGMWSDGATAPNFYQVSVTAGGDASVNYQTYVADRTGFASIQAAAYQGTSNSGDGGSTTSTGSSGSSGNGSANSGTMAQRLDLTPRNVVLSGSLQNKLTFQIMNGSSKPITLKSMSVKVSNDKVVREAVAGAALYDNPLFPIGSRTLSAGYSGKNLASGLVEFSITGATVYGEEGAPLSPTASSLAGRTVTMKLKFKDGSATTVTVQP